MVDKTHGNLQTRMVNGSREERRVQLAYAIQQRSSGGAEFGQNLFEWLSVVVGLIGFAIPQVCHSKLAGVRHVILHSREPQRFEVKQMTGMLLGRPFFMC